MKNWTSFNKIVRFSIYMTTYIRKHTVLGTHQLHGVIVIATNGHFYLLFESSIGLVKFPFRRFFFYVQSCIVRL